MSIGIRYEVCLPASRLFHLFNSTKIRRFHLPRTWRSLVQFANIKFRYRMCWSKGNLPGSIGRSCDPGCQHGDYPMCFFNSLLWEVLRSRDRGTSTFHLERIHAQQLFTYRRLQFEKVYYPISGSARSVVLGWTKVEKYDNMDSKGIEVSRDLSIFFP